MMDSQSLQQTDSDERLAELEARCEQLQRAKDEAEEEALRLRERLGRKPSARVTQLGEAVHRLEREIAERRQAEEALRKSEERYRCLLASVIGYVYTVDIVDGAPSRTRHGEGCASVTGYTSDDYQRNPHLWLSMVHPEDRPLVIEAVERIFSRKEPLSIEHRIVHKDGSDRWISATLVPHCDRSGGLTSYDGIVTDITTRKRAEAEIKSLNEQLESRIAQRTAQLSEAVLKLEAEVAERKRAEEALRASEKRLSLAQHAGRVGVFDWDLDSRRVVWTAELERIFGLAPGSFEGDYQGWARRIHPDDLPAFERLVSEWLPSGREHAEWEYRITLPDGGVRWIASSASIVDRAADGRPVRMIGTNLDITERKQTEERLRLSLGEKEVLLKEIHHRVKNNLQVISSLVNLQADSLDNPELRGLFQDIRDRVRSMALVHEKLYQSENLSRVEFAEYARCLLSYLWRAHGGQAAAIRLRLDLQPVSLSVEAAVPCGLILNELATNALKHAFPGRRDGEVAVSLALAPGSRVALRVADNGVGLPAGLDLRQSRSLGLRLVQMLGGQLGAAIEAGASPGGGATFQLLFPQQEPKAIT